VVSPKCMNKRSSSTKYDKSSSIVKKIKVGVEDKKLLKNNNTKLLRSNESDNSRKRQDMRKKQESPLTCIHQDTDEVIYN